MLMTILRNVGAWVAGTVAGAAVVFGVETAGHAVWPPPAGLDPSDVAAFSQAIAAMPVGALLAVVAAWFGGAAAGAAVASALATGRRALVGALAGGMTLLGAVATLAMIPHPAWMTALGPTAVLVAIGAGLWVGGRVPELGTDVRPARAGA